jgi:membrane protease YdiL (CAAX protease family)
VKDDSKMPQDASRGIAGKGIAASTAPTDRAALIAPAWHTLSILIAFAYFSVRQAMRVSNAAAAQGPISHGALLRGYVLNIALEWGMAYWAWAGVYWKGGNLDTLTGGRWTSWRSLLADVAIAIPFWIVWELTAWAVHLAVDRVNTPTAPYQPPSGFTEISLWILLSLSAGVCEEIMYRGYLQKQFSAATRSLAAGVILQGAVFGLSHTYQGWKQVMVITALGILYGAFAAWRRNLRANIIAHA